MMKKKKVDYKDIVNNLWKTTISTDPDEDKILKKQIANTNFGMLEKSFNKTSKSCIFDAYGVAKYYQSIYGGTINTIIEYQEITEEILIKQYINFFFLIFFYYSIFDHILVKSFQFLL